MTDSRSSSLIGMLVGSHFRPPASSILKLLPASQSLVLQPEPDNPYDESAVKVVLPVTSLPDGASKWNLEGTGYEMIDLIELGEDIHLGYIGAESNKNLKARIANGEELCSNVEFMTHLEEWPAPAKLLFASDGQPLVSAPVNNALPVHDVGVDEFGDQ